MSTKTVFVIRNQLEQYLNKQSQWMSGKDPQSLYRSDFHDEALNTLIEVNSKDITLRGTILEVELTDKKKPVVEVSKQAIELEEEKNKISKESANIAANESSTNT